MISFDEAADLVRQASGPLGAEAVNLEEAAGRVLADEVYARMPAPRTDCSAMDGYAVREGDLGDFPVSLEIIDRSFAGNAQSKTLTPGTCVRIFTGAPMPNGGDRVVIQEDVSLDRNMAVISAHPGDEAHVRRRGSDFAEGDALLKVGRVLDPRALVAAAAADVAQVRVVRRPRVTIIATGDELAEPGTAKEIAGAIPDSVSLGIAALVKEWGGGVLGRKRLKDLLEPMKHAAAAALELSDVVVICGGASVGERDFGKKMFDDLGLELLFWKVAIRPGKPVWFGRARGRLVMGLPGNPTSAMVTARLFLAPLLAGLSGRDPHSALAWEKASLGAPLDQCGERETFVRARRRGSGIWPLENQDSSGQLTLAASDCFIRRAVGSPPAKAGDQVAILAA